MIEKILGINESYYSFLSGVFISLAANLLTGVVAADDPPNKASLLLASAALCFVSSIFWLMLAWDIGGIQKLVAKGIATGVPADGTVKALGSAQKKRLRWLASLAIGVAVLGIFTMAVPTSWLQALTKMFSPGTPEQAQMSPTCDKLGSTIPYWHFESSSLPDLKMRGGSQEPGLFLFR